MPTVDNRPPLLRMECQHCGSRKHALQYKGVRITRLSEETSTLQFDQPGVCLVCPICDSPSDDVA